MKTDPPVREDGLCFTCLRERPPFAVLHDDPFCTAPCARAFHEVSLTQTNPSRWGPVSNGGRCVTCGCVLDGLTPGCGTCKARHKAREKYEDDRRNAA